MECHSITSNMVVFASRLCMRRTVCISAASEKGGAVAPRAGDLDGAGEGAEDGRTSSEGPSSTCRFLQRERCAPSATADYHT